MNRVAFVCLPAVGAVLGLVAGIAVFHVGPVLGLVIFAAMAAAGCAGRTRRWRTLVEQTGQEPRWFK
jgi:hypothetical protein